MTARSWDMVTPEDVAAFEQHEKAEREKLAPRVDAAVEKIRELEAELDALADEIRHGDEGAIALRGAPGIDPETLLPCESASSTAGQIWTRSTLDRVFVWTRSTSRRRRGDGPTRGAVAGASR